MSEEEEKKQAYEQPEVIFKKIGRQDAAAGVPSRYLEIEEHFRTAYLKGYEEMQQEIQEKLAQAARCGHLLNRR